MRRPERERVLSGRGTAAEEIVLGYRRSTVDVTRIVVLAVVVIAAVVLVVGVQALGLDVERDASRLIDGMPATIGGIVHGLLEWLAAIVIGGIALTALVTSHFRLLAYALAADALAFALMALALWPVDDAASRTLVADIAGGSGLTAAITSGEVGVAMCAASFTALAPFVLRRMVHLGLTALAVVVAVRLAAATGHRAPWSSRCPSAPCPAARCSRCSGAPIVVRAWRRSTGRCWPTASRPQTSRWSTATGDGRWSPRRSWAAARSWPRSSAGRGAMSTCSAACTATSASARPVTAGLSPRCDARSSTKR